MAPLSAGERARLFAKGDLPTTYFFKTREGGIGVLQIVGFTEREPRGVKIRYKMAKGPSARRAQLLRPAEPPPAADLVKSGRVPAFRGEIHDNAALNLDTGAAMALTREDGWPEGFDVAWDNDGGGVLMRRRGSAVRLVALPGVEKGLWDEAIPAARSAIPSLRTSAARGIFARDSRFAAILTSDGHLAIVEIGDHSPKQAVIYWWLEKIPSSDLDRPKDKQGDD
jgi:hypothetical protein